VRAVEQGDAADEGRLEASRSIIVGPVTANQGKVVRPSQLIPSVRPTVREEHEEAAPGVTTAREVNPPDGAAAAPHK
jgi:hypothetical protein